MALYECEIDPENDPPKILFIGPDGAGNVLEVIGGELAGGLFLIWHADRCRPTYLDLPQKPGG